jgi:hypothetical protein
MVCFNVRGRALLRQRPGARKGAYDRLLGRMRELDEEGARVEVPLPGMAPLVLDRTAEGFEKELDKAASLWAVVEALQARGVYAVAQRQGQGYVVVGKLPSGSLRIGLGPEGRMTYIIESKDKGQPACSFLQGLLKDLGDRGLLVTGVVTSEQGMGHTHPGLLGGEGHGH